EEVEDVAAAAVARPLARATAREHDRRLRLPADDGLRVSVHADLTAAERVVRADLDRLVEHRSDPERVDRAHRLHDTAAERDLMSAWVRRERIGNRDRALVVGVHEILARECGERSI